MGRGGRVLPGIPLHGDRAISVHGRRRLRGDSRRDGCGVCVRFAYQRRAARGFQGREGRFGRGGLRGRRGTRGRDRGSVADRAGGCDRVLCRQDRRGRRQRRRSDGGLWHRHGPGSHTMVQGPQIPGHHHRGQHGNVESRRRRRPVRPGGGLPRPERDRGRHGGGLRSPHGAHRHLLRRRGRRGRGGFFYRARRDDDGRRTHRNGNHGSHQCRRPADLADLVSAAAHGRRAGPGR
mmetsp:Transcript_38094/g.91892  ORF Transcript_38094/g.91892 Transcript_38094/m.91892 type:complete len:235 (+) Transcript_38094:347-1051(+)